MISKKWEVLGQGSYNTTYRKGDLVFKVSHDPKAATDLPERSVRLWNLMNPHIHPPAALSRQKIKGKWERGWTCPYIKGKQATDTEMQGELLAIFNRTGRIIVDAIAPKNFIKTRSGQIVCIDVGLAMELEQREQVCLLGLTRKPSFTSLDVWHNDFREQYSWLNRHQPNFPASITTIKALLFIKEYRPDITNVDFLKTSPQKISLLAQAYDDGDRRPIRLGKALELLEEAQSSDLEHTKQHCRTIFLEYLRTQGTINEQEQFIPHSPVLTTSTQREDIEEAMTLMKSINAAKSRNECNAIIGRFVVAKAEPISALPPQSFQRYQQSPSTSIADFEIEAIAKQLEEETKHILCLAETKKQCQLILETYILSFTTEEQNNTADPEKLDQQTSYYKSHVALHRTGEKVMTLIRDIEIAENFESIKTCLDRFSEELSKTVPIHQDKTNYSLSPEEGLLASTNFCCIIVDQALQRLVQSDTRSQSL
ncbi:MAG: hypothetical protein NXI01_06010 [Gammaproteobacteria bacterium]|nr:hypothetical protein [Gammaproteobacteria bacterium]